jgi:hypothetical protein
MHIHKYLSSSLLLLSLILAVIFSFPAQAAALRVMIVVDADDNSIGATMDATNIEKLAKDIGHNTKLSLHIGVVKIENEFITSVRHPGRGHELVQQAIEKFPVDQGDVVIFYYSGHGMGGNDPKWPGLAVEGRYTQPNRLLEMKWIRDKFLDKQPRLLFVIADACNNVVSAPSGTRKELPPLPVAYKALFLEYKGYLLASSSERGEYSIGSSAGGAFTNRFLRELNIELAEREPQWKNIASRINNNPIIFDEENRQHPQFDASQLSQIIEPKRFNLPSEPPQEKPVTQLTCADGPKAYYSQEGKQCCRIKGGNGKLFCK